MRRFSRWVVLLAAAALTACAGVVPILNIDNATVVSPAGKPLTNEQVKIAIVRAGSALGWAMKDAGTNKLAGTPVLRTHTANIEITYSPTTAAASLGFQQASLGVAAISLVFFVGEYWVRQRLFPHEVFPDLAQQVRDTVRVWRPHRGA